MALKLLLVDDEADIRLILKYRLEKAGFTIMAAGNGQEALGFLESDDYDMVITDLKMPGMDGIQLYKRIKASPRHKHIPVVVMSATVEQYTPQVLESVGEGRLLKPFEFGELLRMIERLGAQDAAGEGTAGGDLSKK